MDSLSNKAEQGRARRAGSLPVAFYIVVAVAAVAASVALVVLVARDRDAKLEGRFLHDETVVEVEWVDPETGASRVIARRVP